MTSVDQEARTALNPSAIASVVLAVLWVWGLGSILAVLFGFRARRQILADTGRTTGLGLATVGIVLGALGIAVMLLATVILVFGRAA